MVRIKIKSENKRSKKQTLKQWIKWMLLRKNKKENKKYRRASNKTEIELYKKIKIISEIKIR